MPNKLINETSPYLLQHAHNPVDWWPWGGDALQMAKRENKPILVSIGYSACHWCHVMERESFENEAIAALMNQYFVCIKVDREERPDVDALYMDSLHAMGGRGGWPLNVFLMPNAKPFYGLTYMPPANWGQLLHSIHNAFEHNHEELIRSSEGFANELSISEIQKYGLESIDNPEFTAQDLDAMFEHLKQHFDHQKGGMDRAPKFPMPAIFKFLLRYYAVSHNPEALRHIEHSLNCIALGGIYDHVGGGWTRYSVDDEWFIPHFEKMLYDNGQLLSVYAEAYTLTKNPLFNDRIEQTVDWLAREMTNTDGGFYAALDADSEGVEGKFYIWTAEELKTILGNDYEAFAQFYNITANGNWEHGFNHLHSSPNVPKSIETMLSGQHKNLLATLFEAREKRICPGLDNKIIASWNGLMLKGLTDAYRAIGNEKYKNLALKNANFIKTHLTENHKLWHIKNDKTQIEGFLEDYAAIIEGYLGLYQSVFDEQWLDEAIGLMAHCVEHFYDANEGFFYFNSTKQLIAQKKEIFDNVVPSSNSIMAHNLYTIGLICEHEDYLKLADAMLSKMSKMLKVDVQWAANWGALYALRASPTAEIAIVGADLEKIRPELEQHFVPNKIVVATATASDLPLLRHREAIDEKTTIYVCQNKTCYKPVFEVGEALELIQI